MNRRRFLQAAGLAAVPAAAKSPRLAAIVTTYHVRSHADNIVTRLLEGHWIHERYYPPSCEVSALYMDQEHPADIGWRLAASYGFPVVKKIGEAVTLGGSKLAVDGVVIVAEHGNYPTNEKHQWLLPRFEFFEQVVKVFQASGRAVPIFTDKHLSYDWKKARQMYDWSRELGFPLMAGSSLPVTFRRPELDHPLDTEFEGAVVVTGGGGSDGGIFHYLETLQCFVERRKGGETGIKSVEHLEGDAMWKAAEQGRWSKALMEAAIRGSEGARPRRRREIRNPEVAILDYNDGFKAAVVMLSGQVSGYLVALKVKGKAEPDTTSCYIPGENSNNFSMLVHGITQMMTTGTPPYPVERTLLTTGALAAVMESAYRGHRRIETPELAIRYRAPREAYYSHGIGS